MSITVNTNMQALRIQSNLNNSTSKMNTAMERMSSGYKINSAKDDAAGLAVSTKLSTTISGSKVASDNASIGSDLLSSTEGTLDVIMSNLQRVRDLTEQAANGTYSDEDRAAISKEVTARLDEVVSLAGDTTFNGISLFSSSGAGSQGVTLQVGTTSSSTLKLDSAIFSQFSSGSIGGVNLSGLSSTISATGSSFVTSSVAGFLDTLDSAIKNVTTRQTQIGAAQNRLEAIGEGLNVQQTNLKSALSTVRDADVAEESASYVQNQILQSASASLLTQANSAPQIALTLIKG